MLRNDPLANAQFNICLNEQQTQANADPSDTLAEKLEKSEVNLTELLQKYTVLLKSASKARRLITLLGTAMEQQLNLRPYTQDINQCSAYNVKFDAGQVRLVLAIYWDLLTREAEDMLQGTMDELTDVEED